MQYIAYFSISGENKISIYQMDPDTGDLSLLSHVTVDGTPAPLVVDSEQRYLYAGLRSTEQIAVFDALTYLAGAIIISKIVLKNYLPLQNIFVSHC